MTNPLDLYARAVVTGERMATIYVLCDSRESDPIKRVRYVGQTVKAVTARLSEHRCVASKGCQTHKGHWIRSVESNGGMVLVEELARVPLQFAHATEIDFISRFRQQGYDLTNTTDGGEGTLGYVPTDATRPRMSAWPRSLEARAKMRAAHLGKKLGPFSAEHRAKISAGKMGVKPGAEVRAKLRAAHLGKKNSAASIAKNRAASLGKKYSAETCAKHQGERNPSARLTAEAVRVIRFLAERGVSQVRLAKAHGISKPVVGSVYHHRTWRHVADYGAKEAV